MRQREIPNDKSQISNKLQIQNYNIQAFSFLYFGHWDLFVIWCLRFVILFVFMHQKYLYSLLTIVWLIAIWYVSSTPSYDLPSTGNIGSTLAHFIEYFILTVLVAKTLDAHNVPFHHHIIMPTFVLMVFVAGLDELHQYLIPGRTPSWFDFSFDILGVVIGFSVYALVTHSKRHFLRLTKQ